MSISDLSIIELLDDRVFACQQYNSFVVAICNVINYIHDKIDSGKNKEWQNNIVGKLQLASQDVDSLIGTLSISKIKLSVTLNEEFRELTRKVCRTVEHVCAFFQMVRRGKYSREDIVLEARSYYSELKKYVKKLINLSSKEEKNSSSYALFVSLSLPSMQNLMILGNRKSNACATYFECLQNFFAVELKKLYSTLKEMREVFVKNHRFREKVNMEIHQLTSAVDMNYFNDTEKKNMRRCTLEIVYEYPEDYMKAEFKIVSVSVATRKPNPDKADPDQFIDGPEIVYEKDEIRNVEQHWKEYFRKNVAPGTRMLRKYLKSKKILRTVLEVSKILERSQAFCEEGRKSPFRNGRKHYKVFSLDDFCGDEEVEGEGEETT